MLPSRPAGPGRISLRATFAGLGALEALGDGGMSEGRVQASFPKVCYLSLPLGLVALVGPGIHPGPLYVGLDHSPPQLRPGDRLALADLRDVPVWQGVLPAPGEVDGARQVLVDALASPAQACMVPLGRASAAREFLADGDLVAAADVLAGAGPGLTPAGDDALAGILFARHAVRPDAAPALEAVARSARTTDLASAFLLWAARGQALAPVHDLLAAAVAGSAPAAQVAASALAAVGHSSGADFAQGLCWGLELPRQSSQSGHRKDSGAPNLEGPYLPH